MFKAALLMVLQPQHLLKYGGSKDVALINPSASSASCGPTKPPKADLTGFCLSAFFKEFSSFPDMDFQRDVMKQSEALVCGKCRARWSRLRL